MPAMMKRAASSPWLWLVVLVIGGCATAEGLRQYAQIEQLRSQQQQQRSDEIRQLAAQVQNALQVLDATIPAEDQEARALLDGIANVQGMIVERAVSITDGAVDSEEWSSAAGELVGKPKNPAHPDTPEEDLARADFRRRARMAGQMREAAKGLGNLITSAATGRRSSGQSGSNGLIAIVGGVAAAVFGGGGLAGVLGRRALRKVTEGVDQVRHEDAERRARDEKRDADHLEMQQQVASLAELAGALESRLEKSEQSQQQQPNS